MARLKSNAQRIIYPSFDGGLNLSVPPESLPRNELKEAVNVGYSSTTGAMTVRGGLFMLADLGITATSACGIPGKRGFLACDKDRSAKYFTWNRVENVSGKLNGNGQISIAEWDGYYLVASGGRLQKFTTKQPSKLETIYSSPLRCNQVFVKSGRAGVVTGENTLRFSVVGDCESWDNNPQDESSGQYIEVGYKDGMNIDAVIPLSKDLIVFKSPNNEPDKGVIWRLVGDYPDWQLAEVAHNTGTFSTKSVQAVGNDVCYATVSGIASLSSVTSYGEIQEQWPDRKVSPTLSRILTSDAELWNIPVKQQLWIKPHKGSRTVWVLDYSRGIWTKFEYPGEVIYADGSNNAVYIFIGNEVYEQSEGKAADDYSDGRCEIKALMRMGTLITGNQVLIRRALVSFGIQPESKAELRLGGFRMDFSHDRTPYYVEGNEEEICGNDKYIAGTVMPVTSRRMCIVRDWSITPEVVMTGGGCSLSTMGLEMSEV